MPIVVSLSRVVRCLGVAVTAALVLAGCAFAPPIPREAAADDRFVLEEDLVGQTVGRGRFTTITGVDRGFTAYLDGTWDGRTLTLVEDFVFDDGETDRKTWRLTRVAPGAYVGTREDVVRLARGRVDGNAFRLDYSARVPRDDGGTRIVTFRDVLVVLPNGDVLNRANVGFAGLHVGTVDLTITREAYDPAR